MEKSLFVIFVTLVGGLLLCGVNCDQILSNEVGVGSNSQKQQVTSFVSSGPTSSSPVASQQIADESRATYFYPVPHQHPHQQHVNWNRDTYADAANEFGYNQQQHQQTQHHHTSASVPGAVYSPAYGVGDAEGYEDSFGLGGGGLGGLGGLGGVAGILGIKGIKGLGLLGLFKAAVPILAILIPALLLLPLIFLFFPVPVITVPAGQRSFASGLNLGDLSGKVSSLARSVLESDKCVERISCEMSRMGRGSIFERTLRRIIPRVEPHMPQALKRIARVYLEQPSGSCSKKYACYLIDDGSSAKKSS